MKLKERIMFSQKEEAWCGVACIAEALHRVQGKIVPQDELAKYLGTTKKDGTDHQQMFRGTLGLGLNAELLLGTSLKILQEHLNNNEVVIVNWMSGFDINNDGHYSILEEISDKYPSNVLR